MNGNETSEELQFQPTLQRRVRSRSDARLHRNLTAYVDKNRVVTTTDEATLTSTASSANSGSTIASSSSGPSSAPKTLFSQQSRDPRKDTFALTSEQEQISIAVEFSLSTLSISSPSASRGGHRMKRSTSFGADYAPLILAEIPVEAKVKPILPSMLDIRRRNRGRMKRPEYISTVNDNELLKLIFGYLLRKHVESKKKQDSTHQEDIIPSNLLFLYIWIYCIIDYVPSNKLMFFKYQALKAMTSASGHDKLKQSVFNILFNVLDERFRQKYNMKINLDDNVRIFFDNIFYKHELAKVVLILGSSLKWSSVDIDKIDVVMAKLLLKYIDNIYAICWPALAKNLKAFIQSAIASKESRLERPDQKTTAPPFPSLSCYTNSFDTKNLSHHGPSVLETDTLGAERILMSPELNPPSVLTKTLEGDEREDAFELKEESSVFRRDREAFGGMPSQLIKALDLDAVSDLNVASDRSPRGPSLFQAFDIKVVSLLPASKVLLLEALDVMDVVSPRSPSVSPRPSGLPSSPRDAMSISPRLPSPDATDRQESTSSSSSAVAHMSSSQYSSSFFTPVAETLGSASSCGSAGFIKLGQSSGRMG